jgi:WD40 repeat protein
MLCVRVRRRLITNDVEPIHTLIGHTAAVYSVALSSSKDRIFSAGADGHLRIWELPDLSLSDPYAERGIRASFLSSVSRRCECTRVKVNVY